MLKRLVSVCTGREKLEEEISERDDDRSVHGPTLVQIIE